jgi:hypothetical protein
MLGESPLTKVVVRVSGKYVPPSHPSFLMKVLYRDFPRENSGSKCEVITNLAEMRT